MRRRSKLALLALLLLSSTAVADDSKRMSANNCLLEKDWNQGDIYQITFDRGGARIGSQWDGAFINYVCPLMRSRTAVTTGLVTLKLNLHKYTTSQLLCYAESADMNGSLLKSVSRSTSSVGIQSLSWNGTIDTSSSKGTYAIRCLAVGHAPKGDELFSIDYVEP